eukprot:14565120-Alexandrium_andersonii.AAC.1
MVVMVATMMAVLLGHCQYYRTDSGCDCGCAEDAGGEDEDGKDNVDVGHGGDYDGGADVGDKCWW